MAGLESQLGEAARGPIEDGGDDIGQDQPQVMSPNGLAASQVMSPAVLPQSQFNLERSRRLCQGVLYVSTISSLLTLQRWWVKSALRSPRSVASTRNTLRVLMPSQGRSSVTMRSVVNLSRELFRAEGDAPMTMGMFGETA